MIFIYSALLAGCNGGGGRTRPRSTFAPRFAPILCRFRAFIAPTLARLLFGIDIPTRHAATFAALARVVVSMFPRPFSLSCLFCRVDYLRRVCVFHSVTTCVYHPLS